MDSEALEEAFEHLAFSSKPKTRLKNSVDIRKLLNREAQEFEVTADDIQAELELDEEDDEVSGLDYQSHFTKKMAGNAVLKNATTLEALAKSDFISESFDEIAKTMVSIHKDDLIKKEVVNPGTGVKVPDNGKVFLNYVAVCEGSDEPFDTTVVRKVPQIVDMRQADMLPGFFLAIQSMELKELSKFIVNSKLAFGDNGCPPRIPPCASILYIIEVLQIMDQEMLQSPLYMTAQERATLPFADILKAANELRERGNGFFKEQKLWFAVRKYRKGIAMLEEYPLIGTLEEQTRSDALHFLYANLAQCYLQLDRPAQACTACKLGLKSIKGKSSIKLLFRFAKAKLALKDCEAALRLCNEALQIEPKNPSVQDLKLEVINEQKKQEIESKKMMKGMFKP